MTNVKIYQCLRYYFFSAIQFASGQKSNLSVFAFSLKHFDNPINDTKH